MSHKLGHSIRKTLSFLKTNIKNEVFFAKELQKKMALNGHLERYKGSFENIMNMERRNPIKDLLTNKQYFKRKENMTKEGKKIFSWHFGNLNHHQYNQVK